MLDWCCEELVPALYKSLIMNTIALTCYRIFCNLAANSGIWCKDDCPCLRHVLDWDSAVFSTIRCALWYQI